VPSVRFWTGQVGGTAEYRCHGPGRALIDLGWDVEFDEEGFDVSTAGRVRGDPDVLVLSRTMGDYVPDAVRRIVQCGRTKVVFDIDDWFADVPRYNPASKVHADLVDTMHAAMREADLITCSTPELAEGYAHLGKTVVLPNYLDRRIWGPFDGYRSDRDFLTLGWQGGFHWRSGDLELLKEWVPKFLRSHPDIRFAAVGCPELLDYLDIDGITTRPMPENTKTGPLSKNLHPYPHLPVMVSHIDVGLVPLLDNRFNQAKSWCKGMEYNAMGIPAVASASREYQRFIQPGVNGFLVRKPNRWRHWVERAFDELDHLREMSRKTADDYWIDDHIGLWVDAYLGGTDGNR
jgi:glycosyltransferase involved in cell wall biosynthesis